MLPEKKSNYEKFTWWVYNHLVVFFIVISLALIIFSHLNIISNVKWVELIRNFGYAIFSSGVFAAVLKSIQFTGIFKSEIEKVMLGTDFIQNIKDLNPLWRDVSKTIYHRKFPRISDELENRILETYFPTNTDYYYEDFVITVNIEELSDDLFLQYTQTSKFTVILDETIDKTELELVSKIDDITGDDPIVNELVYFKVDGKEIDVAQHTIENNDNRFEKRYNVKLSGKNKFEIDSKYKRAYSLKCENYKLFRVKTFTKNMDAVISFPDDVIVSFFNIGNVNKFTRNHIEIKNQICRSHKNDVILPQQGFGLSFNKKN